MTSGDWNAAIEADLLPCAHCGSSDVELWETLTDALVCCNNCGCRTGLVFLGADEAANAARKREAITAWNTRQPTTPTTGEDDVERVARALYEQANRNLDCDTPPAWEDADAQCQEWNRASAIAALAAISPTTEDAEKRELVEALGPFAAGVFNDNGDLTIRTHFDAADVERAYFVHRKALASIGERS